MKIIYDRFNKSKIVNNIINSIKKLGIVFMIMLIFLSSISSPIAYAVTGEEILNKAKEKEGTPYVWGAPILEKFKDPSCKSFDCSGLVGWTLTQLGMPVKTRTTRDWKNKNKMFEDPNTKIEEIDTNDKSKWQVGDILLFEGHVSIYAGVKNGVHQQYHAQSPGTQISQTKYYASKPLLKVYRVSDGASSANAATTRKVIEDVKTDINKNAFFYNGIPKGQVSIEKKESAIRRLVLFIKEILNFFLMLLINLFKLPFIGAATLMEIMITNAFEAVVGNPNYIKNDVNTEFYIDHRRAVTVENILLNRIEFLNIDFFISPLEAMKRAEGKTGTGVEISKLDEKAERGGNSAIAQSYSKENGKEKEQENKNFEELPVSLLRQTISKTYYVTLMVSIGIMFLAAVLSAIFGMVSTVAGKKDAYMTYAKEWIKTLGYTLLTLVFIVAVIKLNASFVSMLYNILIKGQAQTYSLYETIRTRAYSLQPMVGYSATIMYVILAWYTVKFALIYTKRLLIVMMMLVVAPFLPVYSLIRKLVTGQSDVYLSWAKEFLYTVLIQSIHVFIYFLFVTIAMQTGEESLFGIVVMIMVLHIMMEVTQSIKNYLHVGGGSHSLLGNILDSSKSLSVMQGYIGASYLKSRKKALDKLGKKYVKPLLKKVPSVAEKAVAGTYNNVQRTKEFIADRFGSEAEAEAETVTMPANNNEPLEENKLKKAIKEQTLQEKIANPAELDLSSAELRAKLESMQGAKAKEKNKERARIFDIQNYVTIDEKGRKRMLPPELRYDNKTGKLIENSKVRTQLKKDLAALVGMTPKDFKNLTKLAFSSLKTSVGVLGAITFLPIYLTDPGFAALATTYSMSFMNNGKSNLKTLQENAKKAKEKSNIEIKILPYAVIPVLFNLQPIKKRYMKRKYNKMIEGEQDAILRGQKIRKYRYTGLSSSYLSDFTHKTNAEILQVMVQKQNRRVDVGNLEVKKLSLQKNYSLGGPMYEKKHDRIKETNKLILSLAEASYSNMETEIQQMFNNEALALENKKFLEASKDMSIEEMEKAVDKLVDKEINYLAMSQNIQRYKAAKEGYNRLSNDTSNKDLKERLEVEKQFKNIRTETLTNISNKLICNLKTEKLSTLTEAKVYTELDRIFVENRLKGLEDFEKLEVYNIVTDTLTVEYAREEIQRNNARQRNTNYIYENADKKTKEYIENIKTKDVADLTIEEMRDLKKTRIKSYSEGMKVIQNVRSEARARAEAGNTQQVKHIDRYYKGKKVSFMFGTDIDSSELEKVRSRDIKQIAKKYDKPKKKKKKDKDKEEKVNPWDIKEDEDGDGDKDE